MTTTPQFSEGAKLLAPLEVADFVRDVLFDPERDYPVVALTTDGRSGRFPLDPDRLAGELHGRAQVVLLETGDATWALTESLPFRLDVYGGAARIWWPGLIPESNPLEHRLFFVKSEDDADRVTARITSAIRKSAAVEGTATQVQATSPAADESSKEPAAATVTAVSSERIDIASPTGRGVIVEGDLPLDLIAECLVEGCTIDVRPVRMRDDGTWECTIAGLLPSPWERFTDEVRPGDVLVGRVQNIDRDKKLVFVDVLPGVVGICHISELDDRRVDDMGRYVHADELLPFKVMGIEPDDMRLQLSLKRAYGNASRPSPSLVAGGKPFVWKPGMPAFESLRRKQQRGDRDGPRLRVLAPSLRPIGGPAPEVSEQLESLAAELDAARQERLNLVEQIRELREQNQKLKKNLRASKDRYESLRRRSVGEDDPLSSERAFLLAIRLYHARKFDEQDRLAYPLRRMRIGSSFLLSVRELDGISVEKIVEVCTQVASGVATTHPAREVHQLRSGSRGAGVRIREPDNAKAWRCSLQDNTAAARRLHWWSVPGEDGGVIEFASVGVHDDVSIPE